MCQLFYIDFLSVALQSVFRSWLLFSRSFEIKLIHSTSSRILRTCDHTLRPTSDDNTQQSEETGIHSLGGIRNPNPRNRTDADPRLRHPGHRDRLVSYILNVSDDSQHKVVIGET